MSVYSPEVGQWYEDLELGHVFEVVAFDDVEGTVDIQYFSGEIEGMDTDTWFAMKLSPVPEPDDATGPYELTREDLYYIDDASYPENRSSPLSEIDLMLGNEWY